MANKTTTGERIREARENIGMTQAKLHELTGISVTQISNYENNLINVGIDNLAKIAKALKTSIDEIYYGSASKKPITSAANYGELIVNCVAALKDEKIIGTTYQKLSNAYDVGILGRNKIVSFCKHQNSILELIQKLDDFETNKDNYSNPEEYKKMILDMTANKINKEHNAEKAKAKK